MRFLALWCVALVGITAAAQQRVIYDGPQSGLKPPVLLKEVKPTYTEGALMKKIQGAVLLKAVVGDDGRVDDVEVVRSLDPELDEQAVVALKQWDFKAGTLDGKAVAVRISAELSFALPKK